MNSLHHLLLLLPLLPGLGAGEPQCWVHEPLSLVLVLPLVRDLVGTVEPVNIGIVHHSSIEPTHHLGDDPLDVVHDGVGVGVGGDVLVVLGLPEGDHVLPDRSINSVYSKSLRLMFQSSPCAADSYLHALVAELGLGLPLVELDVAPPELLDQLLLTADV